MRRVFVSSNRFLMGEVLVEVPLSYPSIFVIGSILRLPVTHETQTSRQTKREIKTKITFCYL